MRIHCREIPRSDYEETARAFALKNPKSLFEYARAVEWLGKKEEHSFLPERFVHLTNRNQTLCLGKQRDAILRRGFELRLASILSHHLCLSFKAQFFGFLFDPRWDFR
jgi:hypothetical protein